MLDGVARRGRQVVSPQRVDQRVDGDDATAAKRKQREEALALPAAHVRGPSIDEDLERPEKPDFERMRHACRVCTHQSRRLARASTGARPRLRPMGPVATVPLRDGTFGWIVARLSRRRALATKQRGAAAWQRHGSRARNARPDPDEQGDQMSSAAIETKTTVERWTADPQPDDGRVRGRAPVGPAHRTRPLP